MRDSSKDRVTISEGAGKQRKEDFTKPYKGSKIEDDFSYEEDTEEMLPERIPLQRKSTQSVGFTIRNVYDCAVSISAEYTQHKHDKKWTLKTIARKLTGVPFALLYGFFLVWIISDVIMGKAKVTENLDSSLQFSVARNICGTIISQRKPERGNNTVIKTPGYKFNLSELIEKVSRVKNPTTSKSENHTLSSLSDWDINNSKPYSTSTRPEKKSIFFENDSPELYTVTLSVMGVVGTYSIFSRNTRATMLLILPGLITRQSRNMIFTIVLGILVENGLIDNLRSNFNSLIQNTACLLKTFVAVGCVEQDHFIREMEEATEARCPSEPNLIGETKYKRLPRLSVTLSALIDSTRFIVEQGKNMTENVVRLAHYVDFVRKAVTLLTILMLIVDTVRYLKSYNTDSSFDNMYVDRSARKQWIKKQHCNICCSNEECTAAVWDDDQGLRRWEQKQGFTTSNMSRFRRKELWNVARGSLTTILFSLFVLLTLSADHLLSSGLDYVKSNHKFNVSLEKMGLNTTGSCSVAPSYTNKSVYWIISFFLIASAASCFFEVYTSRIRAKLINGCFPDRAEERADFLYFRIISGRINRRINLLLQLRREEERRRKLLRSSPWHRFKKLVRRLSVWESHSFVCSGCGWKVESTEEKSRTLSFIVHGRRQKTHLCDDCRLDLPDNDCYFSQLDKGDLTTENGGT